MPRAGSNGMVGSALARHSTLRKALLVCGILSSLVFVGTDIAAGLRYEGYSFVSQYVSELGAIGAPSRPLVVSLSLAYAVLVIGFGLGVRESAGANRGVRLVGNLLVGYGIVCLVGPFTPMHQRGAEKTLTDTLHVAGAVVDVLFIFLIIGFGANAFGKWFRRYSLGTILVFLLVAGWSFLMAPSVGADQATPWVGVTERINIYGFLLWVVVLAVGLLHTQSGSQRQE